MRFARWMLVALAVGNVATAEEKLGECSKEMRPEPIFEKRGRIGLRVLVTRFDGGDATAEKLGAEAGRNLAQELPEYLHAVLGKKEVRDIGLDPDDLQVAYVPCVLTQHRSARKIGQEWGADLVFWGQASCSLTDRECQRMTGVVAKEWKKQLATLPPAVVVKGNVVQNVQKGGTAVAGTQVNVTVKIPTEVVLRTSVTVVAWRGVESRGDAQELKRAVEVTELDFPRLASSRGVALFHFILGVYAARAGFHGLAAASFEQAQNEVYAASERLPELNSILGGSYIVAGMPDKGRAALEKALASCPDDDKCRATAMNDLGWAQDRLGEKKKALEYFEQALPLRRRVGDAFGEAAVLNNMGSVYDDLGEKKKALEYFEQALPLEKRVGYVSGEATTLNNMGKVYDALGEKKKALEYYEQALPLERRVGDVSLEATTLNNIGWVYSELGEKKKALKYYEQALPLERRVGDAFGEASVLNNVGLVYDDLGEKKKALEHYEQALPLSRRAGDVSGEAMTLNNMGKAYADLGEKKKALEYYEQALPLEKRVGDVSEEATTLNNMGLLYSELGGKQKALEYYEQALPLERRVGKVSGEAAVLNNMGLVYADLGEKKKALEHYEQARLLLVRVGDLWNLAVVLDSLGALLSSLGRPADAVARFREAAALFLQRPDRVEAVGSLRRALDVSCKYRLLNAGRQVLDDLRKAGASEDDLALAEARLLGRAGVERSAIEAAWRKVLEGAKALDGEAREMRERVARAGLERASRGAAWNGCAGVLVSRVVEGGPAESLGLRAGDILLHYGGDCLDLPQDLKEHTARSAPETAISLDVWRDGRIVPLQGKGGELGLALQAF